MQGRIKRPTALTGLAVLSLLAVGAKAQPITIENSGFEQPLSAEDIRRAPSRMERTKENPFAGHYACRVHLERTLKWLPKGRARAVFSFSENVTDLRGKPLVLEFAVRFNCSRGLVWPILLFQDKDGKEIRGAKVEQKIQARRPKEWQEIALEFGVPANAAEMKANLYGFGRLDTSFDLDELRLRIRKPRLMKLSYENPQLLPVPKGVDWRAAQFDLNKVTRVAYYPSPGGYEKETALKIKRYVGRYGLNIRAVEQGHNRPPGAGTIALGSLRNAQFARMLSRYHRKAFSSLRKIASAGEGYVLELGPEGSAILAGQDGAGAYYAFRAMLQIVRFDPDRIPQAVIVDWPDHPLRTYLSLRIHKDWTSWEAVERSIFEILAASRYNELTLMCNRWVLKYEDGNNPKLNYGGMGLSRDELKKIIQYANENFITVVPGLNSHSKSEWLLRGYPELQEPSAIRWTACPRHPKFYQVLFPAMKEIHEVFGRQPAFMIGHDEIRFSGNRQCPFCKDTPKWRIVLDDIVKQAEYLQSLGVKEVRLWTDMLLEGWNGGGSLRIARIRDMLPKDLIVPQHWLGENGVLISGEPFFRSGFSKIIWCPTEEVTSPILPKDVSRYYAIGMNKCGGAPPWNVWSVTYRDKSYRNFQVIFRVGNLLWNAQHGDTHVPWRDFPYRVGTAIMRNTSGRAVGSQTTYVPIELPDVEDLSATWNLDGPGFDFSMIEDEISRSRFKSLYNDGKAILLRGGRTETTIAMGDRCRTIAVLHTLHMEEHAYENLKKMCRDKRAYLGDGIEVGRYELEYADGTRISKTIGLGYNIFFDQHSTFHRSLLLWDASEVWAVPFGKPFLASVYVIENPHSGKEVKCVRFLKNKHGVELALFALAMSK